MAFVNSVAVSARFVGRETPRRATSFIAPRSWFFGLNDEYPRPFHVDVKNWYRPAALDEYPLARHTFAGWRLQLAKHLYEKPVL